MNKVAILAAVGLLGIAGTVEAREGFNRGVFNRGVFNRGVFNRGVFNRGVFNRGVFNNAAYASGAYNTTYVQDGTRQPVVTKTGAVAQGEWDFLGTYPVTPGQTFKVEMSGTGDPDLYVKFNDADYRQFACRPYVGGPNEVCYVPVPAGAHTAYVSVNGYTAGTYSTKLFGHDGIATISNGFLNPGNATSTRMRATGTVAANEWALIGSYPVTAGRTFTVKMTGTADADLYVKLNGEPTGSSFDCRPYAGGSVETCSVAIPAGVTYAVVAVAGYAASSSFDLDIVDFDFAVGGMKNSYGYTIDNVALEGTALSGTTTTQGMVTECEEPYGCWQTWGWEYRSISPYGFIGATQEGTIVDDDQRVVGTATLRIEGVTEQRDAEDNELLYSYTISAWLGTTDASGNTVWGWHPFCGRDLSNAPVKAIPLVGTWNYQMGALYGGSKISSSANQITWACLDAALGKAAASHSVVLPDNQGTGYGYKPYKAARTWYKRRTFQCVDDYVCRWDYEWIIVNSTLASSHQAATRLIRADYCGDGVAHTSPGRRLDVWDMLPDQINTKGINYDRDASWTVDGANDFGCNGRVDNLWPSTCQAGQVYCEGRCPVYEYEANGQVQTAPAHEFSVSDDGMKRCLLNYAYETGYGFNKNELVNTSPNWTGLPDKSIPKSMLNE